MSISTATKERLATAVTSSAAATELVAAIDAQGTGPAAFVAPFNSTASLTALAVTATTFAGAACAGGATPTATQVNTAIDAATAAAKVALDLKADNADVETLRTEVASRLNAITAKVDAILAAMVVAGTMAAS